MPRRPCWDTGTRAGMPSLLLLLLCGAGTMALIPGAPFHILVMYSWSVWMLESFLLAISVCE